VSSDKRFPAFKLHVHVQQVEDFSALGLENDDNKNRVSTLKTERNLRNFQSISTETACMQLLTDRIDQNCFSGSYFIPTPDRNNPIVKLHVVFEVRFLSRLNIVKTRRMQLANVPTDVLGRKKLFSCMRY
jgi:hypothetical protein